MGQEFVVPAWAKTGPAKAFAGLNAQDDSLSEGIGQGYPVIGYKGKIWSFRYHGERKTFVRPDDGTPSSYLDVIILGQAKSKSKSYYTKFDQNSSDGERPICSSIDGVAPDHDVLQKQADACALCPRNVWKTDENGRKGRDCQDYKRLAVLVLPTMTAPLNNGIGVLEPAFLRVPPASLNSLATMGKTMDHQGFHYASYITRIKFHPEKAHPEMVFEAIQGLKDEEAPMVLELRQDLQVERIIHGGYAAPTAAGPALAAPQPSGLIAPPNPSTGTPSPTLTIAGTPSAPTTVSTGLGSAPPAGTTGAPTQGTPSASPPTATASPTPPASPSGLQSGLGAQLGTGLVTPATATVTDAAAPEASDDDLDKEIAGMLAAKSA
jgi:hypothetical protein